MWIWLVSVALTATADVDTLTLANRAYDNYDFAQAAQLYERALKSGNLVDQPTRSNARVKLSFSRFIAEDKTGAEEALRQLFADDPGFQLERKGVHPDLLKFYDTGRDKATASAAVSQPQTIATRSAPKAYEPAHIVLRLLPLGIGQFANGDPVFGAVFLSGEVALTALHITSVLMQNRTCNAKGEECRNVDEAMSFFVTRNVSAGLLIGVAVFGVIDAILWSPRRGEERAMKMALSPTPHGATLVVSKDF